jgi:dihydroflavonol-4-reductase
VKTVVIGASGHIGNAVVRALLAHGHTVTACGRRPEPPANLAGLSVAYFPGDANRAGQFERWIQGSDLVVDAAAPFPLEAFSAVAAGGVAAFVEAERRTRRIIEAVRNQGATLAYVGSFVTMVQPRTAYDRLQSEILRLAHPYFEVKRMIESEILDAGRRGLRTIVAAPTYCLGPWDLRPRGLCTIPLLMAGEIPGAIGQMLNVIDVRDVAEGIIAAVEHGRFGERLLLRGHDLSVRQLYEAVCEIGGARPPRLDVPAGAAMVSAYVAELMIGLAGRESPLPSGGMMMAAMFDYLPSDGALETLGIAPRPISETLGDAIKWYRQIGYC